MTGMRSDKTRALAQLEACPAQGLSPRAAQSRQSLLARLRSPVGIGVFGMPGSGKRQLVEALVGPDVAPRGLALPSFALRHATRPRTEAVLPDGNTVEIDGYPDACLAALNPLFLEIGAPVPRLAGCRVLLVAAEASRDDLSAALDWAAGQVDVSIWCSRDWTGFEQAVWQAAPDSLRNHAILLLTGDGTAERSAPPLFETVVAAAMGADGLGEERASVIADALAATIDEATVQDVLAAEAFLHRHGGPVEAPEVAAAPPAVPVHGALQHPTPAAMDPAARQALGRAFQHLRGSADALRLALPEDPGDLAALEDGREVLEGLFETLADRICGEQSLERAWPELCADVAEARDLALLLRIEGGAQGFEDAAMLLVQLREEMETRLAA
ncbi:hypothetical protein [Thetidibacter halocola]|uniref:Uncharacterized protein n=1 Tax=Thetidibacter halocola TaxID=2827239 RepID=A0A8J8B7L9_9RHOB|nr:hypothetical protein [Thetidibacter halocola]MBS0123690.1 hypothetical protein [Thetidibacter halocola]